MALTSRNITSGFYIGNGQDTANNEPGTYSGGWEPVADIHDFRYYGRALSTTEIRETYDTEKLLGDEAIRLLYQEDPHKISGKITNPSSPATPYEVFVKNIGEDYHLKQSNHCCIWISLV